MRQLIKEIAGKGLKRDDLRAARRPNPQLARLSWQTSLLSG